LGEEQMNLRDRPWDLEPSMIALAVVYGAAIISGILVVAGLAP